MWVKTTHAQEEEKTLPAGVPHTSLSLSLRTLLLCLSVVSFSISTYYVYLHVYMYAYDTWDPDVPTWTRALQGPTLPKGKKDTGQKPNRERDAARCRTCAPIHAGCPVKRRVPRALQTSREDYVSVRRREDFLTMARERCGLHFFRNDQKANTR